MGDSNNFYMADSSATCTLASLADPTTNKRRESEQRRVVFSRWVAKGSGWVVRALEAPAGESMNYSRASACYRAVVVP